MESPEGSPARGERSESNPGPVPQEKIYLQRLNDFQPQEGIVKGPRESDPPIVVRDGRRSVNSNAVRHRGSTVSRMVSMRKTSMKTCWHWNRV